MHIKAFSTAQYQLISRAVFDQWQMQRALIRARAVQVIDQLRAGLSEDFQFFVRDLVCSFIHFLLFPLLILTILTHS